MSKSVKFSLFTFGPFLIIPYSITTTLFVTVSMSTFFYLLDRIDDNFIAILYLWAWVLIPSIIIIIVLVIGKLIWDLAVYPIPRKFICLPIWILLDITFFLSTFYIIATLGAIGASDYDTSTYFTMCAEGALILLLANQILIIPWTYIRTKSITRQMDREDKRLLEVK